MNQLNLNRTQKSDKPCAGGLICTSASYDSGRQFYEVLAPVQAPHGQGQQHYSQPRYSQLPQFQQDQALQQAQQAQQQQQGGFGGSDWVNNFHAYSTSVSDLTNYGNKLIANSPMFKPFSSTSAFATPSSGLVPTGQYYMQ